MITKEQSVKLKGLAVLAMLWLHLFNSPEKLAACTPWLAPGGKALAGWLVPATAPVAVFLLLSGYGLYYGWRKITLPQRGRFILHNVRRLARLYLTFWAILVVFVTLGSVLYSGRYVLEPAEVVSNLTAWRPSWYLEAWFLFPYALFSLTCPWLFRWLDRWGSVRCLLVLGVAYVAAATLISRYFAAYFTGHWAVYQVAVYFYNVFAFMLGAAVCRGGRWVETVWSWLAARPAWGRWALLATCVVLKCTLFEAQVFNPLYALFLVLLFSSLSRPSGRWSFLTAAGRESMPMWLIHTWFCQYLFADWIYSFRYPMVMFVVLVALSYATAWLVSRGVAPLVRRI